MSDIDLGPRKARHGAEVGTLAEARRQFLQRRSPRLIAVWVAAALVLRIVLGGWSWRDAVAAVAIAVVYPFGEWAIHVYLLHLRPFALRGRRIELPTARSHREHHMEPNRLGLVLLAGTEVALLLGLAIPIVIATGALVVALVAGSVPFAPLVTAALVGYLLVGAYEWCHFLIHTAYKPRGSLYRSIWLGHRRHHFKNEHYWHGITNTVADRVFGTNPEHTAVPRSDTARTLDPGAATPQSPRASAAMMSDV